MPKIATDDDTISRTDHAYHTLRSRIITGDLAGGARLRQHQIARELGITTNPLREALMLLKRDGLVEMEPNMGARVREWDPERHIRRLDVRIALESEIGMLAAERASAAELRELADCARELDTMRVETNENRVLASELDTEIHRSIARASHNPELLEFWEISIVQPMRAFPASYWREHIKYCQPWSHSLLIKAIATRDRELARQAVRRHIAYSRAVDVRVMGLEWKFPQYVTDGVPVEVEEGSFRELWEL